MIISISNPIEATRIFIAIFTVALFLSMKRRTDRELFPISVTQELKGLAILAIVFAHVGYALVSDNRFLFPLSIMAGAGVDLFLFLSGYGLVVSGIKRNLSVKDFYRVRLLKLFSPLWLSITAFFLLDFFILGKTYSWWGYVLPSFVGIFPSADLSGDLNSPLWYFTFILFYYLMFPIVFSKRKPWLSATIIYAVSYIILHHSPLYLSRVIGFYELHTIAFPLGMIVGGIFCHLGHRSESSTRSKAGLLVKSFKRRTGIAGAASDKSANNIKSSMPKIFKRLGYYLLLAVLMFVIAYTACHSGSDKSPFVRQLISIVTMSAITLLFLVKKTEVRLLYWFGLYSYEIYLLHWPILSRYDIFFRFSPSWVAMAAYLCLFLALGWLLRKADKYFAGKCFNL
ncbi:MAG: acyltransferase family protein [Patescibacteria group bacterium]